MTHTPVRRLKPWFVLAHRPCASKLRDFCTAMPVAGVHPRGKAEVPER